MSRWLVAVFAAAAVSAPCVGPRSFSEIRAQWDAQPELRHTRPAFAMHNWTTHEPGDVVPPDNVTVGMVMYGIKEVDAVGQTATVDLILRKLWVDPRLAFRSASEGGCFSNPWAPQGELAYDGSPDEVIWTPGVAIMNEDAPSTVLYSSWWVYPDGLVWWASKVQAKVKCNFDFSYLPYDRQMCPIRMVGWRDVLHDVALHFQRTGPKAEVYKFYKEGMTTEWDILGIGQFPADPADSGFAWGGEGLEWKILMKRRPAYFERYNLLPTHFILLTTYLSFFISRYAVPARVAVVMINMLALINIVNGIRSSLPRFEAGCWLLNYIMMAQCFVMYAAVEYAAVNMLTRAETRIKNAIQRQTGRHSVFSTRLNATTLAPVGRRLSSIGSVKSVKPKIGRGSCKGMELAGTGGAAEASLARARAAKVYRSRAPPEAASAHDDEEDDAGLRVDEDDDEGLRVDEDDDKDEAHAQADEHRAAAEAEKAATPASSASQAEVHVAMGGKGGSTSPWDAETLDAFGRLGRLLMRIGGDSKQPFPRDEHLDIFNRYVFIPCYAIASGIMMAHLPDAPGAVPAT